MMSDDYLGRDLSDEQIEERSDAFRGLLGLGDDLAPDVFFAAESTLPELIPQFALLPRPLSELPNNYALTTYKPPAILVREDIYRKGNSDPRGRAIIAHELGHLLLHRDMPRSLKDGHQERKLLINSLNQSSERQADLVMLGLLVPRRIAIQLETLDNIADRCRVPYQVAELAMNHYGLRLARKLQPYQRLAMISFDEDI